MSTASRLGSDARTLASCLLLAGFLSIAPSSLPPWRRQPHPLAAAVLTVGEPTPGLAFRSRS